MFSRQRRLILRAIDHGRFLGRRLTSRFRRLTPSLLRAKRSTQRGVFLCASSEIGSYCRGYKHPMSALCQTETLRCSKSIGIYCIRTGFSRAAHIAPVRVRWLTRVTFVSSISGRVDCEKIILLGLHHFCYEVEKRGDLSVGLAM